MVSIGFSTPGVSSFSGQPFFKIRVLKIPKMCLIVVRLGRSDHLKAKESNIFI
jgi:hypothetical protein